jgi:multisubunit Na+/H+ antiporter MnhE subunit
MNQRRTRIWPVFVTLFWAGIWVLLDGQMTLGAIVFAVFVGIVTARLTSSGSPHSREVFQTGFALLRIVVIFLRELTVSNLQQLRIVLGRRIEIEPRWLEIETRLETDFGRSLFAILISMTPGTLTCEVSESKLLVHVLDTDDPAAEARRLQEVLEAPILRLEELDSRRREPRNAEFRS